MKPIAVLATSVAEGMSYTIGHLGDTIDKWESHTRTAHTKSGQTYIVVTTPEQLMGLEISDFRLAPGMGDHSKYDRFLQVVRERMRK